ncbi:MAG: S26 family signal peptidase [Cyanobacteria bacterium J06626_18]
MLLLLGKIITASTGEPLSSIPNYEYDAVIIPENAYFVLGDNRNAAFDSHIWGFLPRESIFGKVIGTYCPVERQTVLDSQPLDDKNQATLASVQEFFSTAPLLCQVATPSG